MGDAPNYFQAATGPEKLRGQFYTPPELVRLVLERVELRPSDVVLDPSCGDGEFLAGAAAAMAQGLRGTTPAQAARHLAARLVGFDIHSAAVAAAGVRLAEVIEGQTGVRPSAGELRVYCRDVLELERREWLLPEVPLPTEEPGRLIVVGNPPYVEAKRLGAETRARLKKRYPTASAGQPDLYLYLLHVCLDWLRDEDRLAFVLPNKVLVNTNGREIRRRLVEGGRLRGIDFATRAGLFGKAAVYPVVLYAGAPEPGRALQARLAAIERDAERLRPTELPGIDFAAVGRLESRPLFPAPADPALRDLLIRLLEGVPEGRLSDCLDLRWAISFHRQGLREQYVTRTRPDSPHARRVLGGGAFTGNGEVRRYSRSWSGWWIDYDEARLRRDRNPVPPGGLFAAPKVIICQNGRTLRAAYDDEGYALKDTFLCGGVRQGTGVLAEHPRAIVGLLCSRAAHFLYSHVFFGGHVNGGYLHFLASFLNDLPTGRWTPERAAAVEALVLERETAPTAHRDRLEEAIERHVEAALGLTAEEAEAVRRWCEGDENWRLRERVRSPNREPSG